MTSQELTTKEGLKVKLDRFEGHHAVIVTLDGQQLLITKDRLPKNANIGDELWLHIETNAMREEGRKKMAKALLDEILNPVP